MPYLHLIDEAIGLLNTEMRIVKWRIKYPEQYTQHANKLFLSPLHLTDKTSLVNIMEIVSGLFLSKKKHHISEWQTRSPDGLKQRF